MWYVTLLLIHFCMLSSGCNAYQACVDDLPSCQGQLCSDVSWWQTVRLLLLVLGDDVRQSPTVGGGVLSAQPQLSRCCTQSSLAWVNVGRGPIFRQTRGLSFSKSMPNLRATGWSLDNYEALSWTCRPLSVCSQGEGIIRSETQLCVHSLVEKLIKCVTLKSVTTTWMNHRPHDWNVLF